MYTGYTIITNGYNAVRDISQGNFSLHQTFLDGLMAVNPTVRQYRRVAEIIGQQQTILSEYSRSYNLFVSSGQFTASEIDYISRIYSQLFTQSLQNLQELTMVVTAGQVRMNDAERLKSIDRIYEDMTVKLMFLRGFNKQTTSLQNLRIHEKENQEMLKTIYGL
ncbi:TerB family tellurite resistance protein [Belliella sp. DSM 111904]|uniref:TerB family tellurite resistance protein n=1 Tax=Belliella filtrata TaxID=2923435 RepID=A0ABS9V0T0_9BACT|nr:TerB family tellurite resistance protein [Belliella filtrata]MCH7410001.1 TerB family tellurite resistance protein [Belliella filtrata]